MKKQKSINEIRVDNNLFVDIQMGKYLKKFSKSDFDSEREAQMVTGKIIASWNGEICHEHERLDNSSLESKTAWFNSVEIDFDKDDSFDESTGDMEKEMIERFDDVFYFLPKYAIMFLLFAGPAFEAYEYPIERFSELADGEEPTEIEEELLIWAYDIAFNVMGAFFKKKKFEKEHLLDEAYEIAIEELDPETASEVVLEIYSNIEKHFDKRGKEENRPKTKKKKRK
ncbi:MAG: hypothetical protein KJ799_10565 [Bacteroidetes bacterium]|nr:hypothetical protein [Bacteroidota bacterium]MBU1679330.1 hypothetical protein [Bacteroidota bacterium]MBU2507150.1 hypothetical protein [Bacteroidota bacterium]